MPNCKTICNGCTSAPWNHTPPLIPIPICKTICVGCAGARVRPWNHKPPLIPIPICKTICVGCTEARALHQNPHQFCKNNGSRIRMFAQVHVSYINIPISFAKIKEIALNGCASARVLHQHPQSILQK